MPGTNLVAINNPNPNKPARPGTQGGGNGVSGTVLTNQETAGEMRSRVEFYLSPTNYRSGQATHRPVTKEVKTRAGDLLGQLASGLNIEAGNDAFMQRMLAKCRDTGMGLSEFLEACDPSENYSGRDGELDAYERQLMLGGIRVKSQPGKGMYADTVDRFFSSSNPGSQVLFPEFINRTMRETVIAPSTLMMMIASTQGVDGDAYRTIYTNDTPASRRMYRVAEASIFPKTVLATSEHVIRLFKYGVELQGTYEYYRKVKIDQFAILLKRIAMQADLDKADSAADVAINGDGNSNPATNYNQSALDTGTTPTYTAYLAFAMNFFPYKLTTIVGNAQSLTKYLGMARPSVDPLTVLSFLQNRNLPNESTNIPQNFYGPVDLVLLPNMTSGVLLGLDNRFALEQVVENGAQLVETDRFIQSQRNSTVISEKVGFAKIFNEATLTWTWNA